MIFLFKVQFEFAISFISYLSSIAGPPLLLLLFMLLLLLLMKLSVLEFEAISVYNAVSFEWEEDDNSDGGDSGGGGGGDDDDDDDDDDSMNVLIADVAINVETFDRNSLEGDLFNDLELLLLTIFKLLLFDDRSAESPTSGLSISAIDNKFKSLLWLLLWLRFW